MQYENDIIRRLENDNIKDEDNILDILFETFEHMLADGRFEKCDNILKSIDCSKIKINFLIGILSVTLPYKDCLIYRHEFVSTIEIRIFKSFGNQRVVNNLLFGLN